ncbi:MAG: DegT/DnrJ/EryC1/StrS family aminotransferase [Planctomycetes bacterium]|nr:DegT/DnrJ/EryC1/StrS family aminotransferase [Planctomycetota bacterium]
MAKLAINGGKMVLPKGVQVKWPQFDKSDEKALLAVFRSGKWWRGGTIADQAASECGKFERAFAKYQDAKFGLCVPNGTIAVELALRAAGVKPGDEVIVPALSFVVSASAALPLGAVPVFADCDPKTLQMDPAAIEAAISPRTAAIVIVHFGGYPADLDRIVKIARKHKLPLIEDCAHAQGSQWRGKGVGSYGQFGTFSFQQSKALTSGEGGIVVCNTADDWRKAYRFHNLGRLETQGFYDFYEMSSNYRLTDLQGAILNSQFVKLKKQVGVKMANTKALGATLKKIGGLEPLPADKRITRRGYYYFCLQYDADEFKGLHREDFLEAIRAEGVMMGHGYGRSIHNYPLFQNMKVPGKYAGAQYKKVHCPNTEKACADTLCTIHQAALLADRKQFLKIADAVAKIKDNIDELVKPKSTARKAMAKKK